MIVIRKLGTSFVGYVEEFSDDTSVSLECTTDVTCLMNLR